MKERAQRQHTLQPLLTMTSLRDLTEGIPRECIECDGPECNERNPSKRCSRCRCVYYCSVDCQKRAWKFHKAECHSLDFMRRETTEELFDPSHLLSSSGSAGSTGIKEECSICLNPIKDPVTLKECKHSFCTACMVAWQARSVMGEQPASCPYCRGKSEDVEQGIIDQATLLLTEANLRKMTDDTRIKVREEAAGLLETLVSMDDVHPQAAFLQAQALISLQDGQRALTAIDRILVGREKRAKHPTLERLAVAAERGDEEERARLQEELIDLYEKGEHAPPRSIDEDSMPSIYQQQGEAFELLEQWSDAFKSYVNAVQSLHDPESVSVVEQRKIWMALARTGFLSGQYDKAIHASQAAIEMNRHFEGVHMYKGLSEKALGRLDDAISTMNQAVLYETPWDNHKRQQAFDLYKELLAMREETKE